MAKKLSGRSANPAPITVKQRLVLIYLCVAMGRYGFWQSSWILLWSAVQVKSVDVSPLMWAWYRYELALRKRQK